MWLHKLAQGEAPGVPSSHWMGQGVPDDPRGLKGLA